MTKKIDDRKITIGLLLIGGLVVLNVAVDFWRIRVSDWADAASVFPERSLVRAEGDPKVYYIQNETKRWIPSEDVFRVQGLRDTDISVVSPVLLGHVPEGAPISEESALMLTADFGSVPDLTPFAPLGIRVLRDGSRQLLNFSTNFWNRGGGPFIVRTGTETVTNDEGAFLKTFQKIIRKDGTVRERRAGTFFWDITHNHYHNDHFMDYILEPISQPGAPIIKQKTAFCMRDDAAVALAWNGAPQSPVFKGCRVTEQGVSVGWADVYPRTLPGQSIDITGLPAGIYRLSFVIDPLGHFLEGRTDNNQSAAILELNPAAGTVRVISTGAPYVTADNRYEEGMLIKGDGDPRVYVIHRNRKRWLRTEEIFRSYGYAFANIRSLPAAVVEAIPLDTTIQLTGQPQVYFLNAAGYRRRVLNPTVLTSYGVASADIARVSAQEFAGYPETTLIRRNGDTNVFSIATKQSLGPESGIEALGYDPASIHVVNQTDFDAYGFTDASRPVEVTASSLDVPWDMAFLPGGDLLVTERSGTVRRLGASPAAITLPSVLEIGEGGLMGMALHPNFAENHFVYLYFTTAANGNENRVVRFRLEGNQLIQDRTILEGIPAAEIHDGGQVAFGPDGMLYVSTGDANDRPAAQDRNSLAGKTLRLTPDGGIPTDNPFGNAVWSYGHRNAQGLAWDDKGRMWATEHGRSGVLSGYDELNLIQKGGNYGWPDIQGDATQSGMIPPVRHSGADVTWAPSGMAFLNGKLYFAGLRGAALYEATLDADGRITRFRELLKGTYGRLRAVVVGPDGLLYISTSNRDGRGTPRENDDKILRVRPELL